MGVERGIFVLDDDKNRLFLYTPKWIERYYRRGTPPPLTASGKVDEYYLYPGTLAPNIQPTLPPDQSPPVEPEKPVVSSPPAQPPVSTSDFESSIELLNSNSEDYSEGELSRRRAAFDVIHNSEEWEFGKGKNAVSEFGRYLERYISDRLKAMFPNARLQVIYVEDVLSKWESSDNELNALVAGGGTIYGVIDVYSKAKRLCLIADILPLINGKRYNNPPDSQNDALFKRLQITYEGKHRDYKRFRAERDATQVSTDDDRWSKQSSQYLDAVSSLKSLFREFPPSVVSKIRDHINDAIPDV